MKIHFEFLKMFCADLDIYPKGQSQSKDFTKNGSLKGKKLFATAVLLKMNLLKRVAIIAFCFIFSVEFKSWAQQDSLKVIHLQEIGIRSFNELPTIGVLVGSANLIPVGGRKTEVIQVKNMPANLSEKTGRQIFAQIPGAYNYDMDGSGNQINLSVRGLDAHRSWEFNVRQNNIIINTDLYGYPASHYSMPIEAVDRIELIRGTGALQYGQQFGGMLNYVLKSADTTKVFEVEHISSLGSFGLFSTFNSLGGRSGKWTYYAYFQKRNSSGYRDHSKSESDAQHFSLQYLTRQNLNVKVEVSRSTYLHQVPGPLSDLMFKQNPRQATRFRNFYSPEIWIPAVSLTWNPLRNTQMIWASSMILGKRGDVAFPGNSLTLDSIGSQTKNFAPRNVGIHHYNSKTSELRVLHHYRFGEIKNELSVAVRHFHNVNDRNERGVGTNSIFFDLSVPGGWERELSLKSQSQAFSLENQINLRDNLTLAPGIRYEIGKSNLRGKILYLEASQVPQQVSYNFLTWGFHGQWSHQNGVRIFGGFSQANRPVLFQDLIPGDPFMRIAEGLQHSTGYNAEIGFENRKNQILQYNLTFFQTSIGNRIGNIITFEMGQPFTIKSNLGDSQTNGIELWINGILHTSSSKKISVFNASSFMDGRYTSGLIRDKLVNVSLVGNRIESVPKWIIRSGFVFELGRFKSIFQHQFVSRTYSDPLNTEIPSTDGAIGKVPEYHVFDVNCSFSLSANQTLRFGVNNLFNRDYFIKRPTMYPGAGIWPSDGRGFVFSIAMKI